MDGSGVKTSNEADVLYSVVKDNYETILSVYENDVPKDVQEAIDGFSLPPGITYFRITHDYQWSYPPLTPLFEHANLVCELYKKVSGRDDLAPKVIFLGEGREDPSMLFHRDNFGDGPIESQILTLCVMRKTGASGGEFEYIPKDLAETALVNARNSGYGEAYDCIDENAIRKVPMNSIFSFVCNPSHGLAHRRVLCEGGERVVISTEVLSLKR